MIEIKEMRCYAIKPRDIVKYDNKDYMVWAPIDNNGTVQLYQIEGRPIDVINVNVCDIDLENT